MWSNASSAATAPTAPDGSVFYATVCNEYAPANAPPAAPVTSETSVAFFYTAPGAPFALPLAPPLLSWADAEGGASSLRYDTRVLNSADGANTSSWDTTVLWTDGSTTTNTSLRGYFPALTGTDYVWVSASDRGLSALPWGAQADTFASTSAEVTVAFQPCPTCGAGQALSQACAVGNGTYWDASLNAGASCRACTAGTCAAGTYRAATCALGVDAVCLPCTTNCGPGQYVASPCTTANDAVCAACTGACANGTAYVTSACDGVRDDVCAPCDCDAQGTASCVGPAACVCKPGWTGVRCDTCDPTDFVYGGGCDVPCACSAAGAASQSCNAATGACTCNAGFTGRACDACVAGRYGAACAGVCACAAGERCSDGLTGTGACYAPPVVPAIVSAPGLDVVYRGVQVAAQLTTEGVLFSLPIPAGAFNVSTAGNGSVGYNLTALALPPWLSLTGNEAAGYTLTGTPLRAHVTVGRWSLAGGVTRDSVLMATLTPAGGSTATTAFTVNVQPAGVAPVLAAVAPQTAVTGGLWVLAVPYSNAAAPTAGYADVDIRDGLNDTVTLAVGGGAPSWVALSARRVASGRDGRAVFSYSLSGTPPDGTAGVYPLTLSATDAFGLTATASFALTVSAGAALAFDGSLRVAAVQGQAVLWTLPPDAFTSPDGGVSVAALSAIVVATSGTIDGNGGVAVDATAAPWSACAWATVTYTLSGALLLPGVAGTPAARDAGVPCVLQVTALTGAGANVTRNVTMAVANVNGACSRVARRGRVVSRL